MKTLILASALVVGLAFTGPVKADTSAYNSKTTQNVSLAPSSGGAFDGTYLSSKAGSGLAGPTQEQAGKTDHRALCSHRDEMAPDICAHHCSPA